MIKVFKLTEDAKLPQKAQGDMCYDVFANEDVVVYFGEVAVIPTGIKIAPPENYHYSVRDRSGLAVKHGLHIIAGQIDNGYRGELLICMTKLKSTGGEYQIKKGDKIAQLKFEKDETFEILEVENEEDLGKTIRGNKGFGSSDTKS